MSLRRLNSTTASRKGRSENVITSLCQRTAALNISAGTRSIGAFATETSRAITARSPATNRDGDADAGATVADSAEMDSRVTSTLPSVTSTSTPASTTRTENAVPTARTETPAAVTMNGRAVSWATAKWA